MQRGYAALASRDLGGPLGVQPDLLRTLRLKQAFLAASTALAQSALRATPPPRGWKAGWRPAGGGRGTLRVLRRSAGCSGRWLLRVARGGAEALDRGAEAMLDVFTMFLRPRAPAAGGPEAPVGDVVEALAGGLWAIVRPRSSPDRWSHSAAAPQTSTSDGAVRGGVGNSPPQPWLERSNARRLACCSPKVTTRVSFLVSNATKWSLTEPDQVLVIFRSTVRKK